MRPRTLGEFVGQEHVLGPGKLLRRMLDADRLTSVVLWGPPGTGKTALAEVIAAQTGRDVERAHAALTGVGEIRRILDSGLRRLETEGRRTLLILDEIHRFARNQQDVLLADMERGVITLIGLTTQNPYFALRSALVSRSTLLRFEPLSEGEVATILRRAITDAHGLGGADVRVGDDAIAHWARLCDGDARRALNALEVAVLSQTPKPDGPIVVDLSCAEESIQAKAPAYDRTGDEHYDAASAFIKSMRGSDPDAAVYWLARMLEAGEDPRFIARRIAILASEDIGNADPQAIRVAASAWELTERLGLPECRFALAQAAIYMAAAPKSNASAKAIWAAAADVRDQRTVPVPKHLRDSSYRGAKELGHGENYQYPHDSADGYLLQEYLGVDRVYYVPTDRGYEATIGKRLSELGSGRSRDDERPCPPDHHE
ncbi:MAG: replication-associated recombination protein A [Planctomycetota bacterium]